MKKIYNPTYYAVSYTHLDVYKRQLPLSYKVFITVHSAWLCGHATWLLLWQVDDMEGFCRWSVHWVSVISDAHGNEILHLGHIYGVGFTAWGVVARPRRMCARSCTWQNTWFHDRVLHARLQSLSLIHI